jgi:hypothetical protein
MPYSRSVRRAWVICVLLAPASRPAIAGGLVITNNSPKSIGRAGASTVGDDGGGALLVNPAAVARREGVRAQLGLAFVDDELAWQSTTEGAPIARDQAPSSVVPYMAAFGSIGSWVIGAGAMTSSVSDRSLRPPSDIPDPDLFGAAFDYRYLGIAGGVRRDTITVGVARRIGDSVALGLAVAGSRVQLTEVRRMWAGFSGRDMIGSPKQDLEVAFSGSDPFALSVVAGVLLAPEETSIELGASVTWADSAQIDADVFATGTRPTGPSVQTDNAGATLELEQPVTVRAGGRYLGERFVAELGGEVSYAPKSAIDNEWTVLGMRVIDRLGTNVALETVPSRVSLRTHGAIRGAVDAELFAGFLWATAGYAYSIGSVGTSKQSPIFGDLGGHTVGFGLEGSAGGFTFTLGWSRTWATARSATTKYALDNPFPGGDRTLPTGTYDGSVDQVGILLDAELDAPD